jgi:serine/threonine protein kinase
LQRLIAPFTVRRVAKKKQRLDGSGNDVPTRRDRFVLERDELGRGGYARVVAATRRHDGRRLAVKELLSSDNESVARMRREIQVQTRVIHPHVMPIVEADPLFEWYAMPVAEGTLEDLLPTLSAEEFHKALRNAAAGLSAVHQALQIPHRDVSIRNVLALRDGVERRWAMADWGLAARPDDESLTLNTVGPIGTPFFRAPELHDDPRAASIRSDMYSLGRVAELARTRKSWGAEAGLDRFIDATTRRVPSQRPRTFDEAVQLLSKTSGQRLGTYLVWLHTPEGLKTTLLRSVGSATEVVASRPGLFMCDGTRLLQWRLSDHSVSLPAWESRDSDQNPTSYYEASVEDVDLVDFDTGSATRITPMEPRDSDDNFEFERTTEPVGSAGTFLFLRERIFRFGGGAHPNRWVRFSVIDVRTGVEVDSLSTGEWKDWFKLEIDAAAETFRATDPAFRSEEQYWKKRGGEQCQFTLYRPALSDSGVLEVELQITFGCSYAGSDNRWTSYTRSGLFRTSRLSPQLVEVLSFPDALSDFLRAHTGASALGWSVVPDVLRSEQWIAYLTGNETS